MCAAPDGVTGPPHRSPVVCQPGSEDGTSSHPGTRLAPVVRTTGQGFGCPAGLVRTAAEPAPGMMLLHTVAHKPTPYEMQSCPLVRDPAIESAGWPIRRRAGRLGPGPGSPKLGSNVAMCPIPGRRGCVCHPPKLTPTRRRSWHLTPCLAGWGGTLGYLRSRTVWQLTPAATHTDPGCEAGGGRPACRGSSV